MEGSGRGLISRYYTGICLEGLRKTTKNLSQVSRSLRRDLNLAPTEYEAGVIITLPRRSVNVAFFEYLIMCIFIQLCLIVVQL
jgi:hypothetical protein